MHDTVRITNGCDSVAVSILVVPGLDAYEYAGGIRVRANTKQRGEWLTKDGAVSWGARVAMAVGIRAKSQRGLAIMLRERLLGGGLSIHRGTKEKKKRGDHLWTANNKHW